MKKLIPLAALVLLGACAAGAGGGDRTDWSCQGGAAFSVRYKGERAEVFAGGQLYNLPAAVSASGARYANGAVEYWEHQGEATLHGAAGGPYTACRRG